MKQENNKKVKILQIMHGLAPGGIESFVLNVYENIDKSNLDISFSLACEGKQHHEERVIMNGGTIYRTSDLNGIRNIVKHFFLLIKLLKKEGPFDIVHSHIDFFNGINLLAAFIAGVPRRISHAHNTNSAYTQSEKPSIKTKIYRSFMRLLINIFATDRLGCSHDSNIYMYGKKLGNQYNSKVIYNGVNISKFSEGSSNIKKDISVESKKINFITIGRICEQKNSLFIVKVISELRNIREDIHLYWVGKGPQESEVRELVKEYGLNEYISLLGTRNDIPELLKNMDFLLFPSKWEGLPVVLVESQVSGTPCFISDKITQEANIGLCTTISLECDEKEWAQQINNYINNNTYNNQIYDDILEKFNIYNAVKELKNTYLEKVDYEK